jgi:hypothetical protein
MRERDTIRPAGSNFAPLFAALLLAAAFVYGALRLFGIQFAAGEVYPEYSSLRSDPIGAKLLFDGLAGMKGIRAKRNYLPLEYLPDHGATVLLLGAAPGSLDASLKLLERSASRGNRVVLALRLPPDAKLSDAKTLEDAWHVKLDVDTGKGHIHHLYFSESKDWRVLDRVGPKVLAIEKDFGKGTVALFAESDDFTNQSTVAGDRLRQVSAAIGPNSYVVFDEQHLGIAEGGSVMDLARRFRLTGLMLGLALVAALFLWRNAAGFPPPLAVRGVERLAGRTSQAGLLTLLRRHVPPRELAAACWQEWLNGNRGQVSRARVELAAEIARNGADRPLEAVREIGTVLHAKGEL